MDYVPYIAIMLAFGLVHVPRLVVGSEMKKLDGGYNNHDPRMQQAQLEGRGRRALAAHQNGFEAFAPFAAGVLAAVQRGANLHAIAYLSAAFIVARALYIYAYLEDKPKLRGKLWGLGVGVTGVLMILAIVGG
ncbi:MAG TPA: MAPEG family protein [Kofleriaceae bacterium]